MDIRKRGGTMMVEAAVVLPMVILAVITIVYLLIFTYESVAAQASLHVQVRNAAGAESETHYSEPFGSAEPSLSTEKGIRGKYSTGTVRVNSIAGGLAQEVRNNRISCSSIVIDEEKLIRLYDGGRDTISELLEEGVQ